MIAVGSAGACWPPLLEGLGGSTPTPPSGSIAACSSGRTVNYSPSSACSRPCVRGQVGPGHKRWHSTGDRRGRGSESLATAGLSLLLDADLGRKTAFSLGKFISLLREEAEPA